MGSSSNYRRKRELGARILVKIEYVNPAGSAKDRIVWALVQDTEAPCAMGRRWSV